MPYGRRVHAWRGGTLSAAASSGYFALLTYKQVRREELPGVVLPPPRQSVPHRRLQPAADRDAERILPTRRQVVVT